MRHRILAPTTGSTHPVADQVLTRSEFPNTAVDRAARQTGRCRCRRHTAKAMRQRLIRGKQSPAAFVKKRCGPLIATPDVFEIDHAEKASVPTSCRT